MKHDETSRSVRAEVSPHPGATVPQAELAAYLAAHRMGGFLWDFATDRITLDPGAQAIFDFAPGEFDGRVASLHERMVSGDLPVLKRNQTDMMAGAAEYGGYFRVICRDGSRRWSHAQGALQHDDHGVPVRTVGFVRDAGTELGHVAEQTILVAERKHRSDIVQSINASLARLITVDDLRAFLTGPSFLDVVGASGVGLSVVDQDRIHLLATTGLPVELLRDFGVAHIEAPLPTMEAIRRQMPMFVTREDVRDNYPLLWPYIEPTDLTVSAILPLAAQGRPTGALSILYRGRNEFSPEERNLLLALGATLSQSLQRAQLYDREHSVAVALQQAMLPARIPEVTGLRLVSRYRPAGAGNQVGGDWYDVIPLPDGAVALVVGDVQGHDITAAAVMGQLRTALRAYVGEGHSASDVMGRASVFLHDLDTELMATCICVLLDPATGDGQVVRAGHPHPVIHSDGHQAAHIEVPGGLPLGLRQYGAARYPTTHITLGPGDTLLLCTDGLLETRASDLDTGGRRIATSMEQGPQDLDVLADHIIATAENPRGNEDDIALLLARRTKPGPAGTFRA